MSKRKKNKVKQNKRSSPFKKGDRVVMNNGHFELYKELAEDRGDFSSLYIHIQDVVSISGDGKKMKLRNNAGSISGWHDISEWKLYTG